MQPEARTGALTTPERECATPAGGCAPGAVAIGETVTTCQARMADAATVMAMIVVSALARTLHLVGIPMSSHIFT
jgi:hypothetical protein